MIVRSLGHQQLCGRIPLLCLLAICASITACGQIGPLYLPGERSDNPAAAESAPESDQTAEEPDADDKPDGL